MTMRTQYFELQMGCFVSLIMKLRTGGHQSNCGKITVAFTPICSLDPLQWNQLTKYKHGFLKCNLI